MIVIFSLKLSFFRESLFSVWIIIIPCWFGWLVLSFSSIIIFTIAVVSVTFILLILSFTSSSVSRSLYYLVFMFFIIFLVKAVWRIWVLFIFICWLIYFFFFDDFFCFSNWICSVIVVVSAVLSPMDCVFWFIYLRVLSLWKRRLWVSF